MNTKMLVAAAVLTTALASPALAQTTSQQREQHSVNPSYDVYLNGQYVGSDPESEHSAAAAAPAQRRPMVTVIPACAHPKAFVGWAKARATN
jgi:hypothetical protein